MPAIFLQTLTMLWNLFLFLRESKLYQQMKEKLKTDSIKEE